MGNSGGWGGREAVKLVLILSSVLQLNQDNLINENTIDSDYVTVVKNSEALCEN